MNMNDCQLRSWCPVCLCSRLPSPRAVLKRLKSYEPTTPPELEDEPATMPQMSCT